MSNFFFNSSTDNETATNPMWQILLKEYFFSSCSQSVTCYYIWYLVFFLKIGMRPPSLLVCNAEKCSTTCYSSKSPYVEQIIQSCFPNSFHYFFPLTILQPRGSPRGFPTSYKSLLVTSLCFSLFFVAVFFLSVLWDRS